MPVKPGSLFVLDGQQRLTSIFRVIFRSRISNKTTPDPDLLVALSPGEEWLENPFHLRSKTLSRRMKDGLLVPAEVLFAGVRGENESLAVQRALGEWLTPGDELFFEALDRANAIRMSILQAEVVAYEIDAGANDDNVIEIFARLNQQGVRLRPGDLAAARLTGQMANFRTRSREVLTAPELRGFSAPEGIEEGSRSGAFVDTDLLIRAALFLGGGGVRYRDAEKRKSQTHYQSIDSSWEAAVAGFKSSVALFRNAGVPSGDWLPYRYLLFAPAIAAARGHELGDRWIGWAIAASLWRHYAGEVDTKLAKDAGLAEKGDIDGLIEHVKLRAKRPDSAVPEEDDLLRNIVGEGAIFLGLLTYFMKVGARSFPERQVDQRHPGAAGGAPALPARAARSFPGTRQRIRARSAGEPHPARPVGQRAGRRHGPRRLPARDRRARPLVTPDSRRPQPLDRAAVQRVLPSSANAPSRRCCAICCSTSASARPARAPFRQIRPQIRWRPPSVPGHHPYRWLLDGGGMGIGWRNG